MAPNMLILIADSMAFFSKRLLLSIVFMRILYTIYVYELPVGN